MRYGYPCMVDADIRDLALLGNPMAHNVPRALPFRCGEQFNRRVYLCQIVLRMGDLRVICLNLAQYLGPLLC